MSQSSPQKCNQVWVHFMKDFEKYGDLQIQLKNTGGNLEYLINREDIITVFKYGRHRKSKEGINYILEWKVVGVVGDRVTRRKILACPKK